MTELEKVLAEAAKWVGYLEKDSSTSLADFTKNAGDRNFTYFADWLSNNVSKKIYANGNAWCDTFIDFCFCRALGIPRAKELLIGWSAYTPSSAQLYKSKNQWYSSPLPGDIIFFQNEKRIYHTGIVYKADQKQVYTIEGNTSVSNNTVIENGGAVARKSYLLSNPKIAGYARPHYTETVVSLLAPYVSGDKGKLPEITAPVSKPLPVSLRGIDVSSYQGDIDWNKVKASGIGFALLRGLKKDGTMDQKFEANYSGAQTAGLPLLGVYHFFYALTEQDAAKSAQSMIDQLKGRKLPIWLDLEWNQLGQLGKDTVTVLASAYLDICKKAGYPCHIYSNLDWYRNKYDAEKLKALGAKYWIARYPKQDTGILNDKIRPGIGEALWQYSSQGVIPGIHGPVDLNLLYDGAVLGE